MSIRVFSSLPRQLGEPEGNKSAVRPRYGLAWWVAKVAVARDVG